LLQSGGRLPYYFFEDATPISFTSNSSGRLGLRSASARLSWPRP